MSDYPQGSVGGPLLSGERQEPTPLPDSGFEEDVRIAKMKLSGLADPAIAGLLPGAPRVAREVSRLLDDLLATIRRYRAP